MPYELDASFPLNPEAEAVLTPYLVPGEKLIWCDHSRRRWRFLLRRQWPFVLFLILLFLFFLHSLSTNSKPKSASIPASISSVSQNQAQEPPPCPNEKPLDPEGVIFLSLWLTGFFGLMGYFVFLAFGGPYIRFRFSEKSYALTPSRLIVTTKAKPKQVLSMSLERVEIFQLLEQSDGYGSIKTELTSSRNQPFRYAHSPEISIENIPQAQEVFRLIINAQNKSL